MIPKILDIVRQTFKDRSDKKISEKELEQLAIQFDKDNELEWAKFERDNAKYKEQVANQKLENQKLSIEIQRIKNSIPIKINDNLTLDLTNINHVECHYDDDYEDNYQCYVVLKTKIGNNGFISIVKSQSEIISKKLSEFRESISFNDSSFAKIGVNND